MFESILKNKATREIFLIHLKDIAHYKGDYESKFNKEVVTRADAQIDGMLQTLLYENIISKEQFIKLSNIQMYMYNRKVYRETREEAKERLL